jgi:hypothetical protein
MVLLIWESVKRLVAGRRGGERERERDCGGGGAGVEQPWKPAKSVGRNSESGEKLVATATREQWWAVMTQNCGSGFIIATVLRESVAAVLIFS